jgi:hypothetical protein
VQIHSGFQAIGPMSFVSEHHRRMGCSVTAAVTGALCPVPVAQACRSPMEMAAPLCWEPAAEGLEEWATAALGLAKQGG